MTVTCGKCSDQREVTRQPVNPDCLCRGCSNLGKTLGRRVPKRYRTCNTCGNKKEVNSIREANGTMCLSCYSKQIGGYKRTCIDCGDVKIVDTERDSNALRCKPCSAKAVANTRRGLPTSAKKVEYWYFCAGCDKVQKKRSQQGGTFCGTCNRKQPRIRNRPKYWFNLETMETIVINKRYFKICIHCPEDNNLRQVSSARQAGYHVCKKHMFVGKEDTLEAKEAKRLKTFKKTMAKKAKVSRPKLNKTPKKASKEAIERARKINEEHRLDIEAKKKAPIPQIKTDEDMMAEFLLKSKPSVVADNNEKYPHVWCGTGLGSNSSAMGA